MRPRLSHRWRIALASTAASALLTGALLASFLIWVERSERQAAAELLEAPLSEVVGSLRSGESLDEEVGAQDRVTVAVFSQHGERLFRSGYAPLGLWAGSGEARVAGRDLLYRSVRIGQETVVAASDWTESKRRTGEVRIALLLLLPLIASTVGLAAYVAAGLMYRPLRRLTDSAQSLAARSEIGRLEDPNDPEFSPLARELNALLARIEVEMNRQERLVSDVAHDLRTPLTIIRGRLETALLQHEPDRYEIAMRTAIREAERLSAITDAILLAGDPGAEAEPMELSPVVLEAVERWRSQFERQGRVLSFSASKCFARITTEELDIVLDNLLDNALKYGRERCAVELSESGMVYLKVADDGPGVPPEERERVFERFARLDSSRTSKGNGLGLYLCATIVRRRGGTIRIGDGPGMVVIVSFAVNPRGRMFVNADT